MQSLARQDSDRHALAIIGGGATGTSFLAQVIHEIVESGQAPNFSLHLIERTGKIGPGLAYSDPSDTLILNTPADKMGAIAQHPDDFTRWLSESPYANDLKFPPRHLFGHYLEDLAHRAIEIARRSGLAICTRNNEAVRVTETASGCYIDLNNGSTVLADQVVLALGHFPPTTYSELRGLQGYVESPWPSDRLIKEVSGTPTVCILGCGLSAIDTVLLLRSQGYRGLLTMVSRRGLLPRVRAVRAPGAHIQIRQLAEQLRLTLQESPKPWTVRRLLHTHFDLCKKLGISYRRVGNADPRDSLLNSLRQSRHCSTEQLLLEAFSELAPEIWRQFPSIERTRFHQHVASHWKVLRYPMPPQNGRKILSEFKNQSLRVLNGIREIRPSLKASHSRFQLHFRDKSHGLLADSLINATGSGSDLHQAQNALVRNLLASGQATPDPHGGFRVAADSFALINRANQASARLYALGPITSGTFLVTNSVYWNARFARRLAQQITSARKRHLREHKLLTSLNLFTSGLGSLK